MSCIHHYDVGILLVELANHAIHMEALATAGGTKAEEVTVRGHLLCPLLPGDINAPRNTNAIGVIDLERGYFIRLRFFFVLQAACDIIKRQ